MKGGDPLARLRHHVTGAIERGEAQPVVEQPSTQHTPTIARQMLDTAEETLRYYTGRTNELIVQRDALLTALRQCEAFIAIHADNNDLFHPESNTQKALTAARAAIAAATEVQS